MNNSLNEVQTKFKAIRSILKQNQLSALRLKGSDWFSWATGGGSNVVLLAAETGVAEVFITESNAWILTDAIEAERLKNEEISRDYEIWERPWANPDLTEDFVRDNAGSGRIASDRPNKDTELSIPKELVASKLKLVPEEVQRYRKLGFDASQAMTETLMSARPDWTEFDLAAAGARNLWKRGIHPGLTMAGADERITRYRHPVSTSVKLGRRGMLVFCARRHGLYANLTRFVYFENPTAREQELKRAVAQIESVAMSSTRSGVSLNQVYQRLASAYTELGFPNEILRHHQGGLTGYLAREFVATPDTQFTIQVGNAAAWNPSLPGAKIEDTVLAGKGSPQMPDLEILTSDPEWPSFEHDQRKRPDFLVKP